MGRPDGCGHLVIVDAQCTKTAQRPRVSNQDQMSATTGSGSKHRAIRLEAIFPIVFLFGKIAHIKARDEQHEHGAVNLLISRFQQA